MQTATESIDLRAVQSRIDHLRSGILNVMTREQELLKSRADRLLGVRRETLAREEEAEGKNHARLQALAAERQRAADAAEGRLARRNAWIQQAFHAGKAALHDRAQGAKDRQIGKVQGTLMKNRQARQEELARAADEHQAFLALLVSDRGRRRELRKSLLGALRTYRPWIRGRFEDKRVTPLEVDLAAPASESRARLLEELDRAKDAVGEAGRLPLAVLFRWLPLWLVIGLALAVYGWLALRPGGTGVAAMWQPLGISVAIAAVVWGIGFLLALPVIRKASTALLAARGFEVAAERQSTARLEELTGEIRGEEDVEGKNLSETFRESDSEWKSRIAAGQRKLDAQLARLPERVERLHRRRLAKIDAAYERSLKAAKDEADRRAGTIAELRDNAAAKIDSDMGHAMDSLAGPWKNEVLPAFRSLGALDRESLVRFPPWDAENCGNWEPPAQAPAAVRIGEIAVQPEILAGGLPHDGRFALPDGDNPAAPFALGFPDQASLMIESDSDSSDAATRALATVVLRLLASHPPGRASFVFIDPVGLGKEFAGLMHLADYEETLIHHRIWTQSAHIEERLAEVNEHIEKVIQMYLRNEYATISEYNEQAGTIAEKYRFVVIAGYPSGLSETAARRLRSIVTSGARCGVYLLIQGDPRQPSPDAALDEELRRCCVRVRFEDGGWKLLNAPKGADAVVFDEAPSATDAIQLVHRIGKASIDSSRVQVPFSQIAPPGGEEWTSETTDELRVSIGRTGAKKLQMLAIGKGTRQHVLVAGKTGSGKSTLFHVIVTNLALWCSPREVEFYLIDFKKGVEFACYATKRLPHARVIAIESDREFALSVLQRIDRELRRRGELFRHAGVQDLAGYRRTPGHEPMPRSLLLIDEFQEFFTEDDPVAQEASLLLDRIIRQGRAFGIHVILGSQTMGGAYTLARATLGQMAIRIALQCNEADAQLIMEDDNPAPRMLTRPGEGIYNDQSGALAANSPFQIVWLPENERDALLDRVNALHAASGLPLQVPIVFQGNTPAEVRDNAELAALLRTPAAKPPAKSRAWLGAPNSIKGPTEAVFQRQSGSNLLIVGQSSGRAESMLGIAIVSLAAQFPPDQVEFVVLEPHAHDQQEDGIFQKIARRLPHRIRIGGAGDVASLMAELAAEVEARGPGGGRDAKEVFLIVHDLQRFKALRPDDEFRFSMEDGPAAVTPSQAFANLAGDGGPVGMHVLASVDTWNNVSRWIPRKLLADFEMRVLSQMSAADSANLIDSAAAASLGLHRALLHNEHLGTLETFRPYAVPDEAWFDDSFGEPVVAPEI